MGTHPPRTTALRPGPIASLLLVAAMAGAAPAVAVRFTHVSLEELAARSDACVVGRVVDERVAWNERHDLIVTTWTFEVEQALFGEAMGQSLTVHRLGGVVDGLALQYEGMPELRMGERTAVFLHQRAENAWIISGMRLGVLPERDGAFRRQLQDVIDAPASHERLALGELRERVLAGAAREPRR